MILLTGSTGFVGKHVLDKLLAGNDAEICLVLRKGHRCIDLDSKRIVKIFYTEDMFTEPVSWWASVCKGIDTVIHLAWYVKPGSYLQSPENLSCLAGTLNLARGAVNAKVRRFIGIGTCFEYDVSVGVLSIDTPLKPLTSYAAAKTSVFLCLSQLLLFEHIEFSWCRLFYLYGKGEDSKRLVPYIRKKLKLNESVDLTCGTQIRDFLDVEIAAEDIVGVALSDMQGAVNVCSGLPITVRQLAEKVADEYGKRQLLRFGEREENLVDPPCVVGVKTAIK